MGEVSNQRKELNSVMRGKLLLLGMACVFFIAASSFSGAFAADKVGYINLQRLVNESKMGKDAKNDIEKLRKEKEAVLNFKLKEINSLKDHIRTNSDKMDLREKRDKTDALKVLYNDYQKLLNDAKEDIVREDRELVSIILKKADPILKKVAKKKKYGLILKDSNAIGYLDPDVDITDDVLKELNKKK
jgi:outer membrane protein